MSQTLGKYLINSALPKGYKFDGPVTASSVQKTLEELARTDPAEYVRTVTDLKRLGDEFATVEGISVGLDDIAPFYQQRDPILKDALAKVRKTDDVHKRREIITSAQSAVKKVTEHHPGDMTLLAKSGARGSMNQLMKTVSAPVAAQNHKGEMVPWLIHHAYSEGLRPSEYWVANEEARQNVVEGKTLVTEPGEVGKLMIETLVDHVVSGSDCGTHNGVTVDIHDKGDLIDRFLARDAGPFKRNTLLDSHTIDAMAKKHIKSVVVRSPMTCLIGQGGVCQKCQGLTARGQLHPIGENVGVRAGQALAEPITQMAISAKHGTRLVKGEDAATKIQGLPAIKMLLNVPKTFMYAATLAQHDGKVEKVEKAPQGGHYVYVAKTQHYVPPDLNVRVHAGQQLEAGDSMSDGIPRPDEVMTLKGMGAGRKYIVDKLHDVYKDAGINIDKRHLELLAKAQLNYAEIEDDPHDEFYHSQVVNYNRVRERLKDYAEQVPIAKAEGRILADDYLHHSVGTRVTPSVLADLKKTEKTVQVTKDPLKFKPVMFPLERTPLLREDWMGRLSHRYLEDSLMQGAHYNEKSNIHGYHPIPPLVYGLEFGEGPNGAY